MEFVMAARNSSKSDSTQHSAYYSLFGYEPRITIESEFATKDVKTQLRHEDIIGNVTKAKAKQEASYNKGASADRSVEPGEEVLLRKFGHKTALETRYQPATVTEKRGPDSYIVLKNNGEKSNVNIRDIKILPSGARSKIDPLLAKKVKVFWPKFSQEYEGVVIPAADRRKGSHRVDYPDGKFHDWLVPSNCRKPVKFTLVKSATGRNINDYKTLDKYLGVDEGYEVSDEES
jgi:hypothetical protein